MAIWIRWLLYLFLILGAIPLAMWLAFGPGIALPFFVYSWPGHHILGLLRWSEGSFQRLDIPGDLLLSAFVWCCVIFGIDALLTARHRRRAG